MGPHFFLAQVFLLRAGDFKSTCAVVQRHLRGSVYQALSSLTGNPFALSLVHPAAKKSLGPMNFDAKLAVSPAGERGGRLLVMLWAVHKGSFRGAAH